MRRSWMAAALVVLVTGCGPSVVVTDADPVADPYDGPMTVSADPGDEEKPVLERSGAAGLALECDAEPTNGGSADYVEGDLYDLGADAADALDNYLEAEAWAYTIPAEGYRVEREDDGRVLFSYDVAERTKVAFVAADGLRDHRDDRGWGIESWAQCDPSEWPAAATDALDIGVWTDESGRRVPTDEIRSFQGAEHCDWQDITFLGVGDRREGAQYVRDRERELGDLLRSTYDGSAVLPDDATGTGLRRDGRTLWVVPDRDAAYLVSVADPDDVERWPAAPRPIYCM